MDDTAPIRRRLTGVLFSGVALGATAYIAAVTVSTLAAEEIVGSATLSGVPSATATIGTAIGATLLTRSVVRRGRRPGLITGYAIGVAGCLVAILAFGMDSFPLFLLGMALLGLGNASTHLARYTAAEMYPVARRGAALGTVVWAATIGSVLGPALLQPSGRFAVELGRSELVGGFLVGVVFLGMAVAFYLVGLRPDPATLAVDRPDPDLGVRPSLGPAFRMPMVRVALTAMITGQVVMVIIMVSTPLHIHHHGSDLGIVGLVMSAHTLGMFALSPLTGRLVDRFGAIRVILSGMAVLGVAALGAAYGPSASTVWLVVVLFGLGYGWNLAFVSGSSLLTVGLPADTRSRIQGRVDSLTWGSAALASVSSGVIYQATDYTMISIIGLALLVVPVLFVARNRQATVAAGA
jgi:MFS family permease